MWATLPLFSASIRLRSQREARRRIHRRSIVIAGLMMMLALCSMSHATSFEVDIQPWMNSKCGTCHGGARAGGTNLATDYADHLEEAFTCAGLNVAECAVVRIESGSMPLGYACPGPVDPMDSRAAQCVTTAEVLKLQAWIDLGQPQTTEEAQALLTAQEAIDGRPSSVDSPEAAPPTQTLTCAGGDPSSGVGAGLGLLWCLIASRTCRGRFRVSRDG